ncbi:TM2 domain-containing protein 1, partial [Galemys pyrenaicus]
KEETKLSQPTPAAYGLGNQVRIARGPFKSRLPLPFSRPRPAKPEPEVLEDARVPSMAAAWASGPVVPEVVAAQLMSLLWFVSATTGSWGAAATAAIGGEETLKCEDLKVGQYPLNGYSYKVAVALSLFLGWLGADRFYLGYPALGLLKFCTVGFCGIGSLIDFILISMQIVGPSDGSSYIIDYYGTRLTRLSITNETFRKTQLYP